MKEQLRNTAAMLGASILVVACSSGGGGSDNAGANVTPPLPAGGIEGTGFAVGVISGFGSVIINGVHYDTSDASITVDDNPGVESDLDVGDFVLLEGTISDDGATGTAAFIETEEAVEGPLFMATSNIVDANNGILDVMGQAVLVGIDTILDDSIGANGLLDLADGDLLEVYGLVRPDGSIDASRIEDKPAGGAVEVNGFVSSPNGAADTFMINDLMVNYGGAMLQDFPGGREPAEGDFVEVKGMAADVNAAASSLDADSVELKNLDFEADDGDHAEVEGYVSDFTDTNATFMVSFVEIRVDGGTRFEPAGCSLANGLKVEAEGDFVNNVLVADEIECRRNSDTRVAAVVESNTGGVITVLGSVQVRADDLTQIEDDRDDRVPFGFGDIQQGDYLEIRGNEDPAGSNRILASRIERDDTELDKILVRGIVDSKDDSTGLQLEILGVTVDIDGADCQDAGDNDIACATLFDQVTTGSTIVQAEGSWNGSVLTAGEAELED